MEGEEEEEETATYLSGFVELLLQSGYRHDDDLFFSSSCLYCES